MRYQISSGNGPVECEIAVVLFSEYLQNHHKIKITRREDGVFSRTARSIEIDTEEDLSEYEGTIQWICKSPVRPNHKRKNWFIKFESCHSIIERLFTPKNVKFETFHCGGPGGQNINKVETGVRAIHITTGISVECTEERSQYANKRRAIEKIANSIHEYNKNNKANVKKSNWSQHNSLERGNPKMVFEDMCFKLIKK